jgi:beta-barrel assembly-enhancing protease
MHKCRGFHGAKTLMNWKCFSVNYFIKRRRWLYPFISIAITLSLCLSTALPSRAVDWFPILIRGVQVLQLSNVSERQEMELGQQMNSEMSGKQVKFSRNPQINRYVEEVGQRLVQFSDRPNLKYTFQVVDDDSVNAFATLGGFVYVHTGLLKTAENEAEFASVMAHEIGHIGGKHLLKQMTQRSIASGLASAAGLDRNQAVGLGVELALNRPRSRKDEFDADSRGLKTLSRAGYAQSGMVSFMQKLLKSKSSTPTFLSTHPGTSDRINALKRSINAQPSNGNAGLDKNAYRVSISAIR